MELGDHPSLDWAERGDQITSDRLFPIDSDAVAVTSDDCYTPKWVFDAMGLQFTIDVAAPVGGAPNVPCLTYYTAVEDGLAEPWEGVVWCNPPYSRFRPWAERWAAHPFGVLMGTYAPESASTPVVFGAADCVAFISAKFTRPNGEVLKPRHGLFVAFRGVGTQYAERLANADRFGSVLYARGGAS